MKWILVYYGIFLFNVINEQRNQNQLSFVEISTSERVSYTEI